MDSAWDCSCGVARPWMLRVNTHFSLVDLSQMRSGLQPGRIWLNPETVKSPSLAWLLPFLHPISVWNPIFSFLSPVRFPGTCPSRHHHHVSEVSVQESWTVTRNLGKYWWEKVIGQHSRVSVRKAQQVPIPTVIWAKAYHLLEPKPSGPQARHLLRGIRLQLLESGWGIRSTKFLLEWA